MKKLLLPILCLSTYFASAQSQDSCILQALHTNFDTPAAGKICLDDDSVFLAWSQEIQSVTGDGVEGFDGIYFDPAVAGEGLAQIDVTIYHYCDGQQTQSFADFTYYIQVEDCNAPIVDGCTDSTATNFDASANDEDGTCSYDLTALDAVSKSIISDEVITADDITGQILSTDQSGSTLTVNWVVLLPNSSFELTTIHDVSNTSSGVVPVQLDLTVENSAPTTRTSKTASTSKTITRGTRVSTTTATKGEVDNAALVLFPQPAIGTLNIALTTSIESVDIYSPIGKLIKAYGATNTVDVSSFANGVYVIRVVAEGREYVRTFVK